MTRYDPHPQDYDDARTGPQASREAAGRDETTSRVSGDGQALRGALEALLREPHWTYIDGVLTPVLLPEDVRAVMEALDLPTPAQAPEPSGDVVERAARVLAEYHHLGPEQWRGEAHALADAGLLADPAETESLRSRALGDEQCCPDACDGGACETCPGCSAGWCVNGHDFAPGVWEQMMSEEDHQQWFDVAREHNRGIDAALSERDRARARVTELEAERDVAQREQARLHESRDRARHLAAELEADNARLTEERDERQHSADWAWRCANGYGERAEAAEARARRAEDALRQVRDALRKEARPPRHSDHIYVWAAGLILGIENVLPDRTSDATPSDTTKED